MPRAQRTDSLGNKEISWDSKELGQRACHELVLRFLRAWLCQPWETSHPTRNHRQRQEESHKGALAGFIGPTGLQPGPQHGQCGTAEPRPEMDKAGATAPPAGH